MLGCGDVGHTGLLVSSFSVNSLLLSSGFSKSGKAEKVFCVQLGEVEGLVGQGHGAIVQEENVEVDHAELDEDWKGND